MGRFKGVVGLHRWVLMGAALLISACQTVPQSNPAWPGVPAAAFAPAPKIESLTTRNGKGIPNGRSDSADRSYGSFEMRPSPTSDYGYTASNPVRTTLGDRSIPTHIWFLNSLRGPKGEVISYERIGACCAFRDPRLPLGGGLLDAYRLNIDGAPQGIIIYMDMYRPGVPFLPQGLTQRPLVPRPAGSTPLKPGEMKI